jgi:hypothetical protein
VNHSFRKFPEGLSGGWRPAHTGLPACGLLPIFPSSHILFPRMTSPLHVLNFSHSVCSGLSSRCCLTVPAFPSLCPFSAVLFLVLNYSLVCRQWPCHHSQKMIVSAHSFVQNRKAASPSTSSKGALCWLETISRSARREAVCHHAHRLTLMAHAASDLLRAGCLIKLTTILELISLSLLEVHLKKNKNRFCFVLVCDCVCVCVCVCVCALCIQPKVRSWQMDFLPSLGPKARTTG